MPPAALLVMSIAGITSAAIILARKREFNARWQAWLAAHPDFLFPIEAAGSLADKLAAGGGSGQRAVVASGRFSPGGEGRFQPTWIPPGGRQTRCCRSPGNAALCAESPCRTAPHWGIDIVAPLGTPVYATKQGLVLRAGTRSGYGNTIEISHTGGDTCSVYAHLSQMRVRTGDSVEQGQHIGDVGYSGIPSASAGNSHLHFEVHSGATTNFAAGRHRLDPASWLQTNGIAPAASSPVSLALRSAPQDEWTDRAMAGLGTSDWPSPWAVGLGVAALVAVVALAVAKDPFDDEV